MPNYYNPYQYYPQQQMPQQMSQVQQQAPMPQQTQIQNGGFVSVRNEMDARNYPVAYGNSVTFKDENAPYIYVKTMGFSQLESPTFDKYRLVKEEPKTPENRVSESEGYKLSYDELKAEIEALKAQIRVLKDKVEGAGEKPKAKTTKKEVVDDAE